MIVPLLPVFLVANLTVNERDWKYGPEVIYDATINGTQIQYINETEKIFVHNTTMKMLCRPKNETTFSCRFQDPRTVISLVEPNGKHRVINDSKIFNEKHPSNSSHLFEFNADPDQLDDNRIYTASSSISWSRLDVVRSFIDILNGPAFLPKLRRGGIGIMENSTVGIQCKTKYFVTPIQFLENNFSMAEEKTYKILIAPRTKLSKENGIFITRTRMPHECYALMFGILADDHQTDNYRTSSKTDMVISENTFVSNEETTLHFYERKSQPDRQSGTESISLSLEDIVPAKGPLPIIRDPQDFGAGGTQVFHSRSAAEWLFTRDRY